ncbi:hypothetical protein [Rhizobium sp. FKY42]|uniref:hypothetical protein n=1 Tax=Rhizobium sp. FKY42 TaxID=2562310 RepID=UPI0010C0E7F6|nr:hypothetical protein [Rhizobium sp. FKY42]
MTEDKAAQTAVEQTKQNTVPEKETPPAGPHARDELTDEEKTPGTGALPDKEADDVDAGSE